MPGTGTLVVGRGPLLGSILGLDDWVTSLAVAGKFGGPVPSLEATNASSSLGSISGSSSGCLSLLAGGGSERREGGMWGIRGGLVEGMD